MNAEVDVRLTSVLWITIAARQPCMYVHVASLNSSHKLDPFDPAQPGHRTYDIYIYITKFVSIATNQKSPEFQRWSWIFRLDLTAQTLNCRQHLYYLVRTDSQGGHHGGRVSQRHPIKQVWPLREVHEQASREDDRPRGRELRRREMGQTQEDPEPRVPSREAQGWLVWLSNFPSHRQPTYIPSVQAYRCVCAYC